MTEKYAPDAFYVGGARFDQPLAADRGQARERAARVAWAGLANKQPFAREPIDQARQAAAGKNSELGKVAHPHLPIVGAIEVKQHLVGTQRDCVDIQKLGIKLLRGRGVRPEHPPPSEHLTAGEVAIQGC